MIPRQSLRHAGAATSASSVNAASFAYLTPSGASFAASKAAAAAVAAAASAAEPPQPPPYQTILAHDALYRSWFNQGTVRAVRVRRGSKSLCGQLCDARPRSTLAGVAFAEAFLRCAHVRACRLKSTVVRAGRHSRSPSLPSLALKTERESCLHVFEPNRT